MATATTTTTKVKISVRVRPFLQTETEDGAVEVVAPCGPDDGSVSVTNPRDPSQRFRFNFQSCWGHSATQEALFDRDVRPLLEQVYKGFTACIFCYGVTSSGKTYSMQGSPSQPGIIPRVVRTLFEGPSTQEKARRAVKAKKGSETRVEVYVSYMEIYKDDVYDLLVTRADAPKLPIREADGKIFVANLTEIQVSTPEEFDRLFSTACKSRSTGSTLLNRASSRSHAILGIRVRVMRASDDSVIEGKIHLIDLAGSENNKLTGNDPSRMAESSAINRSLSVLGQVVDALNRGLPRIPYRDSKLTRILQDALGGSALSLLICNIAPGNKFRQDTLNTLNFASRTKEIENRAVSSSLNNDTRRMSALPRDRTSLLPQARPGRVQAAAGIPRSNTTRQARISNESAASNSSKAVSILTEDDMKEQIAKAVAEEVRRQMEEKMTALAAATVPSPAEPPAPTGNTATTTQKDGLAEELCKRVEMLEKRNNIHGDDDEMAVIMSPDGKKKLAQALVAMARACQDKGQLDKALDCYKRAQTFAKHNTKLQVRIDEVQAALEEGKTLAQFKKDRADRASGGVASGAEHSGHATRTRSKRHRADDDTAKENDSGGSLNLDSKGRRGGSKRRKSNDGTARPASPAPALPSPLRSPGTDVQGDYDTDNPKGRAKRSRLVPLGEHRDSVIAIASGTDSSVEILDQREITPAPFGKRAGKVKVVEDEDDWVPEEAPRGKRRRAY